MTLMFWFPNQKFERRKSRCVQVDDSTGLALPNLAEIGNNSLPLDWASFGQGLKIFEMKILENHNKFLECKNEAQTQTFEFANKSRILCSFNDANPANAPHTGACRLSTAFLLPVTYQAK